MATHSSIFPGESNGQRSLAGYSSQGCKESDMTKGTEHACMYTLKILLFSIQKLRLNKIYHIPKVLYTGSITDFNGHI